MADATLQHDTVQHGVPGAYEAPLFGAYSKKVGMWLFLASDSLTFGALLFAFSYNRLYTIPWPTPFHAESIANATIMTACLLSSSLTMVMAVFAVQRGDRAWTRNWLLATMVFGTAFIVLHGMEWSKLIGEGLTIPGFRSLRAPPRENWLTFRRTCRSFRRPSSGSPPCTCCTSPSA